MVPSSCKINVQKKHTSIVINVVVRPDVTGGIVTTTTVNVKDVRIFYIFN